jgi:hypothetical protein
MEPESKLPAQVSVWVASIQVLYLCLLPAAATLALALDGETADAPVWVDLLLAPWSVFCALLLVRWDSLARVRVGLGLVLLFDVPVLVLASQLLGGDLDPARVIIFDALVEITGLQLALLWGVLLMQGGWFGRVIVVAFAASIPGYPLYLASPILADEARRNPAEFAMLALALALSTWGYWKSGNTKPPPHLESYRRSDAASLIPVGGFVLWLACAICVGVFPHWFA